MRASACWMPDLEVAAPRGPADRTPSACRLRRRSPGRDTRAAPAPSESSARRSFHRRPTRRPADEDLAAARRVADAGGVERPGDRRALGTPPGVVNVGVRRGSPSRSRRRRRRADDRAARGRSCAARPVTFRRKLRGFSTLTCSPSSVMSTPAPGPPAPPPPSANSYSASSGKVCVNSMPPRVPSGSPSMWRSCASPGRRRDTSICDGRQRAVADRQAADLHRRGDVALNQRRRHGERLGDVVEALARAVGRQQRVHVDVEREQIADRVGVLGAVQPMQRRRDEARRWDRRLCRAAPRAPRRSRRAPRVPAARAPLGGIMPVLIFLTTFSHVSASGARPSRGRACRAPGRRSSRAGCGR